MSNHLSEAQVARYRREGYLCPLLVRRNTGDACAAIAAHQNVVEADLNMPARSSR